MTMPTETKPMSLYVPRDYERVRIIELPPERQEWGSIGLEVNAAPGTCLSHGKPGWICLHDDPKRVGIWCRVEPATASPAREDRLFESGCCFCGADANDLFAIDNKIYANVGARWHFSCAHKAIGSPAARSVPHNLLDAEITRRCSLAQPAEEFKFQVGDRVSGVWVNETNGQETNVGEILSLGETYNGRPVAMLRCAANEQPRGVGGSPWVWLDSLRLIRRAPQAEVKPVESWHGFVKGERVRHVLLPGYLGEVVGPGVDGIQVKCRWDKHGVLDALPKNLTRITTVPIQPTPTVAADGLTVPANHDPYLAQRGRMVEMGIEISPPASVSDLDDRVAATRAERDAKKRAQALADFDRSSHPPAWPADSFEDVGELGVLPHRAVRP